MAALNDRLMTDLATFVGNLTLTNTTGVTGDVQAVLTQDIEDSLNAAAFPVVIVTDQGQEEIEDEEASGFEHDGVIYPVLILIVDAFRPNWQLARPDYLAWRHTILQAVRDQSSTSPQPNVLPNCPELIDMRAKNLPIRPDDSAGKQFILGGVVALCQTAEKRLGR